MKEIVLASTSYRIYSDEDGKVWHLWDNSRGSDGFVAEIILSEGADPKFTHGPPKFMILESVKMSGPPPSYQEDKPNRDQE